MSKTSASKYARHAAEEMWAFLTKRKEPNSKHDPTYKRHETPFRKAQKRPPLRFFDLPAELRNQIYLELLTLQNIGPFNRAVCWPEILATCKQINHEAGDMLYANNTVDITIRGGLTKKEWRGRPYCVAVRKVYCTSSKKRLVRSDLIHLRKDFKRLLFGSMFRAHHIRLNINIAHESKHRQYSRSKDLYTPTADIVQQLCVGLAANKRIRSFEVNVQVENPHIAYCDEGLRAVLRPLAKIGKPDIFTFNGLWTCTRRSLYEYFRQHNTQPGSIQ